MDQERLAMLVCHAAALQAYKALRTMPATHRLENGDGGIDGSIEFRCTGDDSLAVVLNVADGRVEDVELIEGRNVTVVNDAASVEHALLVVESEARRLRRAAKENRVSR